jgi:phosphomannomutase
MAEAKTKERDKMKKRIFLFDVDGTLCKSGEKIGDSVIALLKQCDCELGIVGGGTYDKLSKQLPLELFKYVFAECGSVVYTDGKLILTQSVREHRLYRRMNELVKTSLKFIAEQDYTISGHLIDRRCGLIYISLVGMQATPEERQAYLESDRVNAYRRRLFELLHKQFDVQKEGLSISYGGEVGISLYPSEWDKKQVLKHLGDRYQEIHYFGDKYLPGGNDYELINSLGVIGHRVDGVDDTLAVLKTLI